MQMAKFLRYLLWQRPRNVSVPWAGGSACERGLVSALKCAKWAVTVLLLIMASVSAVESLVCLGSG